MKIKTSLLIKNWIYPTDSTFILLYFIVFYIHKKNQFEIYYHIYRLFFTVGFSFRLTIVQYYWNSKC